MLLKILFSAEYSTIKNELDVKNSNDEIEESVA